MNRRTFVQSVLAATLLHFVRVRAPLLEEFAPIEYLVVSYEHWELSLDGSCYEGTLHVDDENGTTYDLGTLKYMPSEPTQRDGERPTMVTANRVESRFTYHKAIVTWP